MKQCKRYPVTVIRYSCLTGKAVWVYRGASDEGARLAYYKACKKEIELVAQWRERTERRCQNLTRMLSECLEKLPIDASLTPEQAEAASRIRSYCKKKPECYMEFYSHIMEVRRRREEDREIRRKMREREAKQNIDYDKQKTSDDETRT